ncbi:ROK family transcriptional regulator [Nocardioides anomalus]|uniref:ROK family transcriptional regulator n=1 Tax=Nocardioides anomalus TaxID=2712223 RepID=A0A6G6W932_9ACTN|nr:ROK family transcriptional regulator [Nocardioides anomalus]QIG41663.1 ROK family transcriptional regulator [Nocardioides anomalus]
MVDQTVAPRDRTSEDLYHLVRTGQAATRSELAEMSGLSRSTVHSAVGRLLASGRLAEAEVVEKGPGSGSGRPAMRLTVEPSRSTVAGIDFGHNHVCVALADARGTELVERRVELDVDLHAQEALETASAMLQELMAEQGTTELAAVAAGIPGPVDRKSGLVQSPTILSSWVGLAPATELQQRLGVPVAVANDAVLGAYGELARGAGRFHRDFLYVKASHGIGAALVVNGQPYTGATGLAGEIGHTQLAGHTELCRCGNRGCLEAVVSVQSIRHQLAHTHPQTDPGLLEVAHPSDPVSERILNEAGLVLGAVLAEFCNLVNPSALVIGGELGEAGGVLFDGVEQAVRRHAQPATFAALEVLPAELGSRAELVGAVHLAVASLPA